MGPWEQSFFSDSHSPRKELLDFCQARYESVVMRASKDSSLAEKAIAVGVYPVSLPHALKYLVLAARSEI